MYYNINITNIQSAAETNTESVVKHGEKQRIKLFTQVKVEIVILHTPVGVRADPNTR